MRTLLVLSRVTVLSCWLVSTCLLSACSDGSDDGSPAGAAGSPATATDDDCRFFSLAEASAFGERDFVTREPSLLGCGYLEKGSSLSYLTVDAVSAKADARAHFGAAADLVDVAGVGDSAAYNVTVDGDVGSLVVQQGGKAVRFDVVFLGITPGTARFDALLVEAKRVAAML